MKIDERFLNIYEQTFMFIWRLGSFVACYKYPSVNYNESAILKNYAEAALKKPHRLCVIQLRIWK